MATATKKKDVPEKTEPAKPSVAISIPDGVVPLTRDQILTAKDIKEEWLEIPEWTVDGGPGWTLVRGLSGIQRDAFEKSIIVGKGQEREVNVLNMRSKLVAATVIDHTDGLFLFAPTDVIALGNKSGAALQRVFEVAARLSGITKEDQKKLTENLDQTPGEDSPTDSPSP